MTYDSDPFERYCACEHQRLSEPRARTVANGSVQYRHQCLACGRPVGTVVARAKAYEAAGGYPPAPFDEVLFDTEYERAQRLRQESRDAESARWWGWYNDYLHSEEWAIRRRRVLNRCRDSCEGCGTQRAVHVHHLTYEHVGAELLFELVGLCETCHEIVHSAGPNSPDIEIRQELRKLTL